jgi:predicted Zn-dependent peptidase
LDFGPSTFEAPDPGAALLATSNGLRAYVISDSADPVVRITAALPLGRLRERAGEAGAAQLLIRALTRGGSKATSKALALRLDSLATKLTVEELPDAARLSLEVLAADWREGLTLMLDRLQSIDVDEDAIRGYRSGTGYSAITAGVSGEEFRPKVELERILAGYPLAPPDPDLSVDPAAVKALASRAVRPDRFVLGVGGAVTKSEVEAFLEDRSGGWPVEAPEPPPVKTTRASPSLPSWHTIDSPGLEGWIAIGTVIPGPLAESERATLMVMTEILNTRLNIATREIRGLSNRTVFVLPDTAGGGGLFHVRTGGRPEAVAPLIHFTREELVRLAVSGEPIATEELEMAKGALIRGDWQKSLDGAGQASATFALEMVRYGGTTRLLEWPGAVEAVTPEMVKDLADKYLDQAEMTTVVVGPIEKIRQARHPRWPIAFDELESGIRPPP